LGTSANIGGILYVAGPGIPSPLIKFDLIPVPNLNSATPYNPLISIENNPHFGPTAPPLISYCPGPGLAFDKRKFGLLLLPILI